jgi:hypothetical protein
MCLGMHNLHTGLLPYSFSPGLIGTRQTYTAVVYTQLTSVLETSSSPCPNTVTASLVRGGVLIIQLAMNCQVTIRPHRWQLMPSESNSTQPQHSQCELQQRVALVPSLPWKSAARRATQPLICLLVESPRHSVPLTSLTTVATTNATEVPPHHLQWAQRRQQALVPTATSTGGT